MQAQDSSRAQRLALGMAIRAARRRRDMSQEAVALESGLERKTVHAIERGKTDARVGTLYRIAEAVDVTLAELLAGRQDEAIGGAA